MNPSAVTGATGGKPDTIHEMVSDWARRSPDQPAVTFGDQCLTYGALHERAGALAALLSERGVGLESRVAVALPRSPAAVVAFLAVLRAGGAYLPIDPDYPEQRRLETLSDSGAVAVVTTPGMAEQFAAAALQVIVVDDDGDGQAPSTIASGDSARLAAGRDNAAYVIYTSGSTGLPKGVVVEHGQVVDLACDDTRLAIRPGEVVAQFAPTAFDASVFEIWCTLGRGGTVAVLRGDHVSVLELGQELRRCRPDWLFLTTGLFHVLIDHDPQALAEVGCLITGGDVLSPQHIRTAAALPRNRTYAAYGPTETTVFASLHGASPEADQVRVPIGSALTGMSMRVLDDALRELPTGEPGEIYIGGDGVARGYHNRPALTAERFVPDPFSEKPGSRLYRTGDLGRRLPDGELEFLSRVDRQVKVRGFRVELGELEAVLSAHPDVGGAAVVAFGDGHGRRLASYVVPAAGRQVTKSDVRVWMSERLPAFMVPSTCVVLDELPRDPNDKVDRAALPYPWAARDSLADLPEYCPPRTEVERIIADVWAETLGLDQVGIADNFYELGGDSLRSVEVLEQLRPYRIEVTAGQFFRHQTVAELAELVQEAAEGEPVRTAQPTPVEV